MAIISGKARIEFNGVDLGEMTFFEVRPQPQPVTLEQPKAIELTVKFEWTPEAMPIITDLVLQAELGEHYKN